jgi:hypothetical protein
VTKKVVGVFVRFSCAASAEFLREDMESPKLKPAQDMWLLFVADL